MTKLSIVQGIEEYKTPVTLGDGVVTITDATYTVTSGQSGSTFIFVKNLLQRVLPGSLKGN